MSVYYFFTDLILIIKNTAISVTVMEEYCMKSFVKKASSIEYEKNHSGWHLCILSL